MKNPFSVLKIENEFTFEQEIESIKQKLEEVKKNQKMYEDLIHGAVFNVFNKYNIGGRSIEEALNERFILGFNTDKKYFSKEEYEKIWKMLEEEKIALGDNGTENEKIKILKCTIAEQFSKLNEDAKKYRNALQNYKNEPDNQEYKEALHDIYIKNKFEEAVINLAKRISIDPVQKIGKNSDFIEALTNNFEYKILKKAYSQIETANLRNDLIPETYVRSRNADDSGILVLSKERIKELLQKEKKYARHWEESRHKKPRQKYIEGIAENQNHDYSWGIVIEKPTFCLKNEEIDTPIFNGKISVERLGYFSAQSMFRKRKFEREKKQSTIVKSIKKSVINQKFNKAKTNLENIREYYYKYQAAKNMYDNIYRVTKTDKDGNSTTSIVVSPITYRDMRSSNKKDFIKNVYFSDYMLDVAKQNGGYAGQIFESPQGLSISNKYNQDEIAATILFDRKIPGSIIDKRNGQEKKYYNRTKDDFFRMINQTERTREFNE